MFKFGFDVDADKASEPEAQPIAELPSHPPAIFVECPALQPGTKLLPPYEVHEVSFGPTVRLHKVAACNAPSSLTTPESDLEAGRYEGGYKLWECAGDLVRYLSGGKTALRGACVLELGAGHALPGVYAAKEGAARVDVADYNREVLEDVAAVNFRMNVPEDVWGRVRFVAGDWGGVPKLVGEGAYDVVLAAEVAYCVGALGRFAECLLRVLRPGGIAIVAGKTYYFGVGGGMRQLERELRAAAARLGVGIEMEIVEELRDGKSNVREVLRVLVAEGAAST